MERTQDRRTGLVFYQDIPDFWHASCCRIQVRLCWCRLGEHAASTTTIDRRTLRSMPSALGYAAHRTLGAAVVRLGRGLCVVVVAVATALAGWFASAHMTMPLLRLGFGRWSIAEAALELILAIFVLRGSRAACATAIALQLVNLGMLILLADKADHLSYALAATRLGVCACLAGGLHTQPIAAPLPHADWRHPEIQIPPPRANTAQDCPRCSYRINQRQNCPGCGLDVARYRQAQQRVSMLEKTLGRSWSRQSGPQD